MHHDPHDQLHDRLMRQLDLLLVLAGMSLGTMVTGFLLLWVALGTR